VNAFTLFLTLAAANPSPFCYTNHAGHAVAGRPIALAAKTVTLSNGCEVVTLPLSAFPPSERRRITVDFGSTRNVPADTILAVRCAEMAERRSIAREKKGLCSRKEGEAFRAKSTEALKKRLDSEERSGKITSAERKLIGR